MVSFFKGCCSQRYSGEQGWDRVSLPPDTKERIDKVDSFAEMVVGNSKRDMYQHNFDKNR